MPGKTSRALPGASSRGWAIRRRGRAREPRQPVRRRAGRRRDQAGRPDPALAVRHRRHPGDQRLPRAGGARVAPEPARPRHRRARRGRRARWRAVVARYLEACLHEAMRLWPTTTMLSRETLADTEWGGADGSGRHPGADPQHLPAPRPRPPPTGPTVFAPERWIERRGRRRLVVQPLQPRAAGLSRDGAGAPARARRCWPRSCARVAVELVSPSIDPAKPLPHMLDFFGIRVRID